LSSAVEKQLKTVLVVAHDATNKALLCHILGLMPIISGTSARAMGQSASLIIPRTKWFACAASNEYHHPSRGVDKTAAGAKSKVKK